MTNKVLYYSSAHLLLDCSASWVCQTFPSLVESCWSLETRQQPFRARVVHLVGNSSFRDSRTTIENSEDTVKSRIPPKNHSQICKVNERPALAKACCPTWALCAWSCCHFLIAGSDTLVISGRKFCPRIYLYQYNAAPYNVPETLESRCQQKGVVRPYRNEL